MTTPRAVRNNNPLNIRRTADQWEGMASIQVDPAFVRFISPEYGFRAAAKLIKNYQSIYHINTITGLVARWAPEHDDNPTDSYIEYVSQKVGVGPYDAIDFREYLVPILSAMARFESGQAWPREQIAAGVELAA